MPDEPRQRLDRIIEDVTSRTLVGAVGLSVQLIAEEIAKEALADREFREALRALVRAAARQILADLQRTNGT